MYIVDIVYAHVMSCDVMCSIFDAQCSEVKDTLNHVHGKQRALSPVHCTCAEEMNI